jgi:diacylglycerol O-acyltransferase / wax synthase
MEVSHPYVLIAAGCRSAVEIFTYLDSKTFGINADFDAFPDIDVLATGIRRGVDELAASPGAVAEAAAQQYHSRRREGRLRRLGPGSAAGTS